MSQVALNPGSLLSFIALCAPLPSLRVLGKLGLESTPINTKGYETLLTLVSTAPHALHCLACHGARLCCDCSPLVAPCPLSQPLEFACMPGWLSSNAAVTRHHPVLAWSSAAFCPTSNGRPLSHPMPKFPLELVPLRPFAASC